MQPCQPSQEERFISGVAHIAVLFPALGLALNIALLLAFHRRAPFAAGHLKQALGLQVISIILSFTAGIYVLLAGFGFTFGHLPPGFFFKKAILLGLVVLIFNLIKIILAVVGAIRGFSGQSYRQPLIGDLLDRIG